MLSMQLLVLA